MCCTITTVTCSLINLKHPRWILDSNKLTMHALQNRLAMWCCTCSITKTRYVTKDLFTPSGFFVLFCFIAAMVFHYWHRRLLEQAEHMQLNFVDFWMMIASIWHLTTACSILFKLARKWTCIWIYLNNRLIVYS